MKTIRRKSTKAKADLPEINPEIRCNGEAHAIETMFKEGRFPLIKCVGMTRISENSNSWVSCDMEIVGGEIKKINVGEPNLKLIALDEAKVTFVTKFMGEEE